MSKTFEGMTIDEQKAWWLGKADDAVQLIGYDKAQIEWLAYTHHAVFQIIVDDIKYVLKLSLADNAEQLHNERRLLKVLSDKGLAVSKPLANIDKAEFSGVLFAYLDGLSSTANHVTGDEMRKIGQFLANFHSIEIDLPIAGKSLDWDGLFSDSGMYYPGDENMAYFTDSQVSTMDEVTEKVKMAMDEIGRGEDEFGLIHGDFLLKNILFHEDEVRALDFEYCGWGYYLYDLTPILWQLKPQRRYPQLEQALWDGYISTRPLKHRHRELLETFIAGRQVASMRWIAANQDNPYVLGKVDTILTQRTAELSAFLETGILKRE